MPTPHPPGEIGSKLSWVLFGAAVLAIVTAFVLGGASRENELQTLIVELAGIPALLLAIWLLATRKAPSMAWWPIAILAGIVLVPFLQLVPLPASIWASLPGRDEAAETLRIAGAPPGAVPSSLTPAATYAAFLWLIPPCALFLSVLSLAERERLWLIGLVLVACVCSLLLGGVQISVRDDSVFRLYKTTHAYLPIGFFANRNHQGILMASALVLAACFATTWQANTKDGARLRSILYIGLIGLLAVGVLVTRSRAALALGGPALVASFLIFWNGMTDKKLLRARSWTVGAVAVVLVVVCQIAVAAVLSRFKGLSEQEGRFDAWPTVIEAGMSVQPLGGGIGAFDPLYRLFEPIGLINPFFFNHAHNEYLELWLEAGIVFPILLVAFCAWYLRTAVVTWRSPAISKNAIGKAASVVILILLLHSIVDYPLRTQALACLFAMCCALMVPGRARPQYSQH